MVLGRVRSRGGKKVGPDAGGSRMRRRRLPSGGRLTAFGHRGREAEGGGKRKGGPRPRWERTNVGDVRAAQTSSTFFAQIWCLGPPSGAEGSRRPTSLTALAPPRPFAGGAVRAASTHKRRGRPLGRGGVRRSCAQNAQTSGTSEQRRRPRRSLPTSGVSAPVRGRGLPPAHLPHCPRTAHALSPAAPCAQRQRTNVGDVRLGDEVSDVHAPRTHKRRGRQSSADVLDVLCPHLVSRAPSEAEGSHRPTSLSALAPPRPFAGGAGRAA